MSVTKSVCEIYEVVIGNAQASIVVRTWDNSLNGRQVFGGELLINSSFGTFCNIWPSSSMPFKHYLAQLNQETFLLKTLGIQARVYSPGVTWDKFAKKIESYLADNTLTEAQVALIMLTFSHEFEKTNQSYQAYIETIEKMASNPAIISELTAEVVDQVFSTLPMIQGHAPNPSGVSFWTQLWPAFAAAIAHELEIASTSVAA